MLKTNLTNSEMKLIRKIAQIQISGLKDILLGDWEVQAFCLECGLSFSTVAKCANRDIKVFRNILKNPNKFIDLDEDNMSIAKHILYTRFRKPKYEMDKVRIWKKLILKEDFLYSEN